MRRSADALARCILAIVILTQFAIGAGAVDLAPGAELPLLEAETLSGDAATLPRDARGHPMVLVVGFTKASAKVARAWLEGCRADASSKAADVPAVSCYDVRMLEEVPKFLRGMTERGMKSGYPEDLQRNTLLVYDDNEAWLERLGVTDKKSAYLIGCDAAGLVRGTASGEYRSAELKRILEAIRQKPQKPPG